MFTRDVIIPNDVVTVVAVLLAQSFLIGMIEILFMLLSVFCFKLTGD